MINPATDDGRDPEEPECGFRYVGQPGRQHLAKGRGHWSALRARRDEFFGEEWVAFRANKDRLDQRLIRLAAEDARQLPDEGRTAKPGQLDAFDAGRPVCLSEPEQQRVTAVELVTPKRDQEE